MNKKKATHYFDGRKVFIHVDTIYGIHASAEIMEGKHKGKLTSVDLRRCYNVRIDLPEQCLQEINQKRKKERSWTLPHRVTTERNNNE